jgi:hypothetical protein
MRMLASEEHSNGANMHEEQPNHVLPHQDRCTGCPVKRFGTRAFDSAGLLELVAVLDDCNCRLRIRDEDEQRPSFGVY